MATPATIGKTTQTRPVELPELQAAIAALAALQGPLEERIERNRARSERCRRNRNGHDDRLVLTPSGYRVECRRCDRVLAIDATPHANGNGKAAS